MSHKRTPEESADRAAARLDILQAVNQYRVRAARRRNTNGLRVVGPALLLGSRQIQQAVFACRQMPGLVPETTLTRAGFKARRPGKRCSLAATAARGFDVPMDMIVDVARCDARRAA